MNHLTDRKRKITAALTGLGDTADTVAATLISHHVTGRRRDPHRCPIANYLFDQNVLHRATPGEGVGRLFIYLTITDQYELDESAAVLIPTPVAEFLRRFDTRDPAPWPELVAADSPPGTTPNGTEPATDQPAPPTASEDPTP
jgi:hypothetical protein